MGSTVLPLLAVPLTAVILMAALAGPSRGDARVTVDPDQALGTWEGFGCSLAWWANQFGTRDDLADTLFTTRTVDLRTDSGSYRLPGLGFNIVRYNIGGTSSAPAFGSRADIPSTMAAVKQIQGFWLDWGSDDPSSASWDWSVDANQRAMLGKAKSRGVNLVEAFSDAPMWWMCTNHSTAGSKDGGDNLQSWNYRSFAKYLAIIARQARDKWRIEFDTVEPFNEPSAWWWKYPGAQEGCHFEIETQKQVIAHLRAELDARGLSDMGISASDENSVDDALRTWNAFDAATRGRVDKVNVHGYYGLEAYRGPNRPNLHQAIAAAGKRLWNSEYGEGDGTGATMARSLLLDINQMRVTGWNYWQPFDSGGWGLVQSNLSDNWIGPPNSKYYVMAQFSRHIRPGMIVLDSGDPNTVAAYSPAAKTLVLVSVNEPEGRWVDYDLSRFVSAAGPVARWMTSTGAGSSYSRMNDLNVTDRAFRAWLPPGSVQTFEVQNVCLSAAEPNTGLDLAHALALIGGQRAAGGGDTPRTDIIGKPEDGAAPADRIDLVDIVLIARKVAGLDATP